MASLEDRAERLAAKATEDYGEAWRPSNYPDHPNPLIAVVLGYTDTSNDYGPVRILNVRDLQNKLWSVWLIPQGLKALIAEHNPEAGQMIYIDYQGQRTSTKTGHQFHAFNVFCETADEASFQPPQSNDDDDERDIPF